MGVAVPSLRAVVLDAGGQDLRRCMHCSQCGTISAEAMDISLEMLVQLAVLNDEEVLTSRTLWLEAVLAEAKQLCSNGIDMAAVILALRREAHRRGLVDYEGKPI